MSLLDTVRRALGLERALEVQDPDAPLGLEPGAESRLRSLPPGQGIHLTTQRGAFGRLVLINEGPAEGPPPPELEPWPITASDADLAWVRGLRLDYQNGRWAISGALDLRARETPNPDGRLYLLNRVVARGTALQVTQAHRAVPDLPAHLLAIPGVRSVLLRDATLTIEREPGTGWPPIDRGVEAAVRTWMLSCGRPLEARDRPPRESPLEEAVEQLLEAQVAPAIRRDGGDIRLASVVDGVATVELVGACRSCPASEATLKHGVERALRSAFPGEIERVEAV
jgi:Fe-S cluster biogenesis protein NfuA